MLQSLSQRIKEIRERNIKQKRGSFLVHLGGAWGSGKSTFVNFLQELMEKNKDGQPWITVHFNAWQHQRLSPPWWYLMDTVYKTALRNLRFCDQLKLRFLEYRWRWSVNSLLSWVVLVLYAILVFLLIFEFSTNAFWVDLDFIGHLIGKPEDGRSEIVIKLLTAMAAITGYLIVWANFLTPNSAKNAGKFIKSISDPLRELHEHFFNMVKEIKRPICVFIDDLDRCQGKYVVELLEGIQTLFRDANITYVIIADINWLCACYSNVYKDFKTVVDEPGKPLGYYFLDKTFQLSFSLPLIGNTAKSTFWRHLIEANEDKVSQEGKRKALEEKAVSDFKDITQEEEIGTRLEEYIKETEINSSDDTEELIQAYRRAAVLKFNEPGTLAQTTHVLQGFAPLLESNPRFMKRLVNEYSMEWTIDKLQGRNIQREKLARWAILKLRWPLLAEYLLNHPEAIKLIVSGKTEEENIPKHLIQLFKDPKVLFVIQGADVGGKLDEGTIKQIANMDI